MRILQSCKTKIVSCNKTAFYTSTVQASITYSSSWSIFLFNASNKNRTISISQDIPTMPQKLKIFDFWHDWIVLRIIFYLWNKYQTILPIVEPRHISNCKVEPLPWIARYGSRAFAPCHIFNCKVEPFPWTVQHSSRAFEPLYIFNYKVEPLYVILNRVIIYKENNKTTMMKNVIAFFSITTKPKITIHCTTSIIIWYKKTIGASMARFI